MLDILVENMNNMKHWFQISKGLRMNSVSVSLRFFKNKFFSGCKHQIKLYIRLYKIIRLKYLVCSFPTLKDILNFLIASSA